VLKAAAEQHARLIAKNILGAVAVVNVKIDNGDALEPVLAQGMGGTDGDIIKDAKSHCAIALGVMPGRANAAKGGIYVSRHHQIYAVYNCTGRTQCRVHGMRIHGGVAIEPYASLLGDVCVDQIDVAAIVHAKQLVARGPWRLLVLQPSINPGCDHAIHYGSKPLRPFRVVRAYLVLFAIRMCDEGDGHDCQIRDN
jgi:hypothetical protein